MGSVLGYGIGAETLAIVCWRLRGRRCPIGSGSALAGVGSAGGLGLVLIDLPHHGALHVQGVVEQLALAGGGVLDQLGEQRVLAGRLNTSRSD